MGGIEKVGSTLLLAKEVGAPPTLVASKELQVAVSLVQPRDVAKQPFVVPGADGRRRQLSEKGAAGVEAPDDMQLPDVEAIGAVLWSSPTDVRGVDLGTRPRPQPPYP